jgi:hypothetical protein
MGMRPVGLVQGFCVMRWSWYGAGSPYSSGAYWSSYQNNTITSYRCPHGYMQAGTDHRQWGANVEQPWMAKTWAEGYNAAYHRMIEEAVDAGAHGVVGVVDTATQLIGADVREFHMYGTAVVVEGVEPPSEIWTSYLAGQRLAKLIEAGLFPVSVVAAMSSVRVWSVCETEILMKGGWDPYGTVRPTDEIRQIADAEMQNRQMARDHIKSVLGTDALHGATLDSGGHEISEGDLECHCTLRGTRVRRFADADPLPAPVPTVTLR